MNYLIDTGHTSVEFSVRHIMISNVKGSLSVVAGTVNFDPNLPATSSVDVTIDANSLTTRHELRDSHLKSPEFLDATSNPTITFKSTEVEKTGEVDYRITGDLTIRGITKSVVLEAEFGGEAKDHFGNAKVAFSAKTSINRKDFGMVWNKSLETGGVVLGDKISIMLEVELHQQAALVMAQ